MELNFLGCSKKWIADTDIGVINMDVYLNNKDATERVNQGFYTRSNSLLKGAIGAINSWLLRVKRPTLWRDGIKKILYFSQETHSIL